VCIFAFYVLVNFGLLQFLFPLNYARLSLLVQHVLRTSWLHCMNAAFVSACFYMILLVLIAFCLSATTLIALLLL